MTPPNSDDSHRPAIARALKALQTLQTSLATPSTFPPGPRGARSNARSLSSPPRKAEPPSIATGEQRRLLAQHESLAHHWARRLFDSNSGEDVEDATQVAFIGLLTAARRFDPARGFAFSTFASATIIGELRRHYRDKTPRIKIPRSVQERYQAIQKAIDAMRQAPFARAELSESEYPGQNPSPAQIAQWLGESEEVVLEAMAAGRAQHVGSLDAIDGNPSGGRGAGSGAFGTSHSYLDWLGEPDPAMERLVRHADLWAAVNALAEQEQQVILLRFIEHRSQAAVAKAIGVSQMQVSRLERKALNALRKRLHP